LRSLGKHLAAIFTAITAGLLGGCDDDRITRIDQTVLYTKTLIQTAGVAGIRTVVLGSPLPSGVRFSPADVISRLALPGRFPKSKFIEATIDGPDDSFGRLILFFNATSVNAERACENPEKVTTANGKDNGFKLFALYCQDGRWVSRGELEVTEFDGLNDEHFARSITNLFDSMFPEKGEQDSR